MSEEIRNQEEEKNKTKREKRKKSTGRGITLFLHFLQHCALVIGAVAFAIILFGSYIRVSTWDGSHISYRVTAQDNVFFEDTDLFLNIFKTEISNIFRYGAIKGQMETNGVFDPGKEVDVTAFANRYTGVPSQYITARYRLEDLIKWAQYGFVRKEVYMTGKEVEAFLSDGRTITVIDGANNSYAGSRVSYLDSYSARDTRVKEVSGNTLLSADDDSGESIRDDVEATVLENRYQTIDGKNIEDQVFAWSDYYELCHNVMAAANDLCFNYETYMSYNDYYEAENSNMVFYIQRTVGNDTQVFTNQNYVQQSFDKAKDQLKDMCEKYVIYEPENMFFYTNLSLSENYMRQIFGAFEYAYPENTRIFIGVDGTLMAPDAFTKALSAYGSISPYYWQYLGVGVLCIFIYLFLLLVLTLREGRAVRKDTGESYIRLCQEDRIPTEIMVAFGAFVAGIYYWLAEEVVIDQLRNWDVSYDTMSLIIIGAYAALVSLGFSFFYYSIVRRWKAHMLWRNSLCRRLFESGKKLVLHIYDNAAVMLRVWVPFGLLVFINIIFTLMAVEFRHGEFMLILVLVIDIVAGILLYRSAMARQSILQGIQKINGGDMEHKIDESSLHGDNLVLAQAVNNIGDGISNAVATSMKDERMKADLITNVSHDIKTPLTSIINYVDLIKRENVDNPKVREYIEVLDAKSQRLKQLTDDLVEASKISSGNITLQWEKINLVELIQQAIGEFSEKFEQKSLAPVLRAPQEDVLMEADSRRIWRVIENLFINVCKYALPGTRVYIDIEKFKEVGKITLSVMNISENPLKVSVEELTERFIRGDESRTTEGSGLGLSIAKNLTEVQKGKFEIRMEGDLFKVILTFPQLSK